MGFFSWKTMDTDESISNQHSERGALPVKMITVDGGTWIEMNYDGYGVFGGQDYFELLAQSNGYPADRDIGIDLYYRDREQKGELYLMYPKLVTLNCDIPFKDLPHWPEDDPQQGYFYE